MRLKHSLVKTPLKSIYFPQFRGNYFIRDLTDVLVEPNVKPEDFVYTKFVTTLIVIVPNVMCEDFSRDYALISDYVVPGSAKKLNVPEKDNLTIWYICNYLGKWMFSLKEFKT